MPPTVRKARDASGGTPKTSAKGVAVSKAVDAGHTVNGKRGRKDSNDKDDDALLTGAKTRWTDSFIVICFVRWIVGHIFHLCQTKMNGGDPPVNGKKKNEKAEKVEVVPPKEKMLQFISEYKIPVGLMVIFVLTCAIIIGGESFTHHRFDREKAKVDDYYGTLGVTRDAETADVKRAYKTLAKRWHPDKNPNCTTCQETFSKIAVAYETLSDKERRSAYDESGDIATTELKSPRSVPLNRDNFDELVTFSNDVWIVQIFKPDDGSCAQFHPFWENQIQKHGHIVRFGRVDLTNDLGKWLPVKTRVLPMILKFARHLGSPEIFPITAMHETGQMLMKFVLTSFPNIGLPLHKDKKGLQRWLSSSTRRHKVLFAIPGRSEEERYKSHLMPRKLAAQWSEIFDFRTAETSELHKLPTDVLPAEVRASLPQESQASEQAAVLFFAADAGATTPKASAIVSWPIKEEELVLQLMSLAQLTAPTLDARSAELLCRSLAIRRVYCLVLLDPPDEAITRTMVELKDSQVQYAKEVAEIRASGADVGEDEDNFVVPALRLFRQPQGLQPSIATCHAPKFSQVENALDGASAFLMDLDTGRMAALKGLTSFRGIYPQLAYEETLVWVDDAVHPFLSLPDCNESMLQYLLRSLRASSKCEMLIQFLLALFLAEALAKAVLEQSWKWLAGASIILLLILLRLPPFLRWAAIYLPNVLFVPSLLSS